MEDQQGAISFINEMFHECSGFFPNFEDSLIIFKQCMNFKSLEWS